MCLIARHLENNGIPTMCVGSALDILQAGRPPRAIFVDYPLGHTVGKPFDKADQLAIVRAVLEGFNALSEAGQVSQLPHRWGDDNWRTEAASTEAKDTRQARDDTPQFQLPADREAALASGALEL